MSCFSGPRRTHTPKGVRKDCRISGFICACIKVSSGLTISLVRNDAKGRNALQRLFTTFPGGAHGIGLLLLRAAVGLTAIATGISYLFGISNPAMATSLLGLALTVGGAAMTIGALTPMAGFLVGLCFLGIAFSWFSAPLWGLHDAKLVASGVIITTAGISLLGPGAYSVDGRLFGRREIVIPPSPRPPES